MSIGVKSCFICKKLPVVASMAIATAAIGLSASISSAAMVAYDTASNYAPSSWSSTPPNLGSGFGPWNIVLQNNTNPPYVGTYLNSGGAVATGGYSWGVYANNGPGRIDLYRPFTPLPGGYVDPSGLGTLINNTFSLEMASDGVGGNSSFVGFSLQTGQTPSATNDITFEYTGGGSDGMTLIDNNGTNFNTGSNTEYGTVSFGNLNGGILVTVAVGDNPDGLNPYTITATNVPGTTTYFSYSGSENGPLQQVDLFDQQTDGNGYFNDLSIVPEPGSLGMLALGAVGLLIRRRRKT